MHDSVITGKEYASKDWTWIISMFLTDFNVYFVCGCACFMCCECVLLPFFNTQPKFCSHELLCRNIEFYFPPISLLWEL